MEIQSRTGTYKWHEDWIKIPDNDSARKNGRTHGVVALKDGTMVIYHQAAPSVLICDRDGNLLRSFGDFLGAHGMTLCENDGKEYLWLTDEFSSRVAKLDLDGNVVMDLTTPEHKYYTEGGKYTPTWATENPHTGHIWVGDGYGSNKLVHRFAENGQYEFTIDGTEGLGEFFCPHGLNFTIGQNGPELFITDRANQRIVVYDNDGNFLRGSTLTHSPCNFEFLGNFVITAELFTGIKILNKNTLELVDEIGVNPELIPQADGKLHHPEGWPDLAGTNYIRPGFFNSPHGTCMTENGDIYVTEWMLGGRVTKLEKL